MMKVIVWMKFYNDDEIKYMDENNLHPYVHM